MGSVNAALAKPGDITRAASEILLPSRRMAPSAAAAAYLQNDKGPFDPRMAPMITEPLDELGGRQYQGIVFVGPQRSSKSFGLIFGGLTWVVTCAPGDAKVIQMTETAARKWSRTDLDRVIRYSPEIRERMSPRPRDNNVFDKWFRNGMVLSMGWPALSHLSSETIKYIFIPDYERPENRDNVDGAGPLWDLALKRIQTWMSAGKCVAESSPGSDVVAYDWKPAPGRAHEAPPTPGILSIYNNGTRGRWYWPCWHCNDLFQAKPGFDVFNLPSFEMLQRQVVERDIEEMVAEYAIVACPRCGGIHEQHMKPAMSEAGAWVHEGQTVRGDQVLGEPRRTSIWSGWLGGVAASYQQWDALVRNYLHAVATYARTGDESPLRLATTSDAGAPYLPRAARVVRSVEQLVERCEEWPYRTVPRGVRFLTAAVDVQGNRFVVSTYGWGVQRELWIVDRFTISASKRPEGERFAALDPGAHKEDWLVLIDEVMNRTYPVEDCDVELPIQLVLCDSGGQAGVTDKAYEFWRHLNARSLGRRLMLLKGVPGLDAPRCKVSWPDARGRRDRKSSARGDVPVWRLNVNVLKDGIAGDLGRVDPGPGYVHLPDWMNERCPEAFAELVAERRENRRWVVSPGVRNEQIDLHAYNTAAYIILGGEQIDWSKPPPWALPPEDRRKAESKQSQGLPRRGTRNPGISL